MTCRFEQVSGDLKTCQQQQKVLQEERDVLSKKFSEAQHEVVACRAAVVELSESKRAEEEDREKREKHLVNLSSNYATAQEELNAIREELNVVKADRDNIQSQQQQVAAAVTMSRAFHNSLAEESSEAKHELSITHVKLSELQLKYDGLSSRLKALSSQHVEMESENTRLVEQFGQAKKELTALRTTHKALVNKLTEYKPPQDTDALTQEGASK